MRLRALVAGGVVAAAAFTASPAAAEPDHASTLRTICEAKDGTFVPHPFFWRARCQSARSSDGADDGLRAPFMICTMQMGGQFFSSTSEPEGRTNWVCL
jgi:hypothetical protein